MNVLSHTCLSGISKHQKVYANGYTRSMTNCLSLQAMGDNMVAVIPAFAQYLSEAAANNLPPASPATSDSVYFDILGLWMISYRASTAKWLHSSVLPVVLLAPPPGVQRGPMARMAGICVLSLLCCLATPAAVGGLRAFISGMSVCVYQYQLSCASKIDQHSQISPCGLSHGRNVLSQRLNRHVPT